jgi:hypothetical protein
MDKPKSEESNCCGDMIRNRVSTRGIVPLDIMTEPKQPKYKIIGLSGKLGAGKDASADIILKWYPQYDRCAFAYNVKLVCSILLGTTHEEQLSAEGKARIPAGFDKTNASYQQIVGQGMRDIVHYDVWVLSVMNRPSEYKLITDVRYPTEVQAIEEAGGIVIRIERDEKLREGSIAGRPTNHSSEIALDNHKFTYRLENNGTFDELAHQLRLILSTD